MCDPAEVNPWMRMSLTAAGTRRMHGSDVRAIKSGDASSGRMLAVGARLQNLDQESRSVVRTRKLQKSTSSRLTIESAASG